MRKDEQVEIGNGSMIKYGFHFVDKEVYQSFILPDERDTFRSLHLFDEKLKVTVCQTTTAAAIGDDLSTSILMSSSQLPKKQLGISDYFSKEETGKLATESAHKKKAHLKRIVNHRTKALKTDFKEDAGFMLQNESLEDMEKGKVKLSAADFIENDLIEKNMNNKCGESDKDMHKECGRSDGDAVIMEREADNKDTEDWLSNGKVTVFSDVEDLKDVMSDVEVQDTMSDVKVQDTLRKTQIENKVDCKVKTERKVYLQDVNVKENVTNECALNNKVTEKGKSKNTSDQAAPLGLQNACNSKATTNLLNPKALKSITIQNKVPKKRRRSKLSLKRQNKDNLKPSERLPKKARRSSSVECLNELPNKENNSDTQIKSDPSVNDQQYHNLMTDDFTKSDIIDNFAPTKKEEMEEKTLKVVNEDFLQKPSIVEESASLVGVLRETSEKFKSLTNTSTNQTEKDISEFDDINIISDVEEDDYLPTHSESFPKRISQENGGKDAAQSYTSEDDDSWILAKPVKKFKWRPSPDFSTDKTGEENCLAKKQPSSCLPQKVVIDTGKEVYNNKTCNGDETETQMMSYEEENQCRSSPNEKHESESIAISPELISDDEKDEGIKRHEIESTEPCVFTTDTSDEDLPRVSFSQQLSDKEAPYGLMNMISLSDVNPRSPKEISSPVFGKRKRLSLVDQHFKKCSRLNFDLGDTTKSEDCETTTVTKKPKYKFKDRGTMKNNKILSINSKPCLPSTSAVSPVKKDVDKRKSRKRFSQVWNEKVNPACSKKQKTDLFNFGITGRKDVVNYGYKTIETVSVMDDEYECRLENRILQVRIALFT
ncbi:uncharacterized protein [Antedon mediterranea]|uniref:uncharacterized protein isoform X2 n=1 Tax=Antedon mediterranea TaxID=105859 RepID=UPI003AF6E713